MNKLILAFTLALTTVANAQFTDPTVMPKTVPFNDANGTQIGTATFSGNSIYIRNLKSEFVATIVLESDGGQKIYDPNGKVIDALPGRLPESPK